MTSEYYNTFGTSPWHRRVLARFRSALAKCWNRFIYEPFQLLIRTLIRWLYGPKLPLFVHDQMSTKEIVPASPLPLTRNRRLSITEFTIPGQSRTVSTYNRLFSKLAKVQHLGTTSSKPPETYSLLPRFHEILVERHDEVQCLLLTKLPLELRLQIYGHVLGYRTLHIIPSHVPSLSLPPRFSLKTYPFHRRLDFEICRTLKSHLDHDDVFEMCIREITKTCELERLTQLLDCRGDIDKGVDKVQKINYFLHKYERKGGPLALLKTCRTIYSEAIEMIYTTNTFFFSTLPTFLLFPTLLPPSRLPNLRHLTLHFAVPSSRRVHGVRYEHANPEWPRACALLRTLPSLHTLTLTLQSEAISWTGFQASHEKESPLEKLRGVEVKGELVVFVGWPVTDSEKSLEAEFGMRLLGKESALETWRIQHNNL